MRTIPYIVILLIVCHGALAQKQPAQDYPLRNGEAFVKENELSIYRRYDFSSLFLPQSTFLGFIGNGYRRISIEFLSVKRNAGNPELYDVEGYSEVAKNKCNFRGTLRLNVVRRFRELHFGVDEEYMDKGIKAQGVVLGVYEFREDTTNSHSGIFSGSFAAYWYLDAKGEMQYDDIELQSDSYRNNQYQGKWTDYKTKIAKVCNWGEYRIPASGDLDIGTGEFFPNPKYKKMGWDDR